MLGLQLTSIPVLIAAGAVGALTIEHGWGWVLGKVKAYRAKAQTTFDEVTAQVTAATADLAGKVSSIESEIAAIKTKIGI